MPSLIHQLWFLGSQQHPQSWVLLNSFSILARHDSIFPLLRCRGMWNRTYTQFSLSQILFQNPKSHSLGHVQRFCSHYWCDSMLFIDLISNITSVYFSSIRFKMATTLVIFYQVPSVSKSRIPLKYVNPFRASVP